MSTEPKTDAKQTVIVNDVSLIKENEMLKAKVDKLEGYLKQAIDVANKANEMQKAKDEAEISDLTDRIVAASNNRLTVDSLKGKTLDELRLIKTTLDLSMQDTFASVAALQSERDRKHAPLLTVGKWDSKTQSWVGGL